MSIHQEQVESISNVSDALDALGLLGTDCFQTAFWAYKIYAVSLVSLDTLDSAYVGSSPGQGSGTIHVGHVLRGRLFWTGTGSILRSIRYCAYMFLLFMVGIIL